MPYPSGYSHNEANEPQPHSSSPLFSHLQEVSFLGKCVVAQSCFGLLIATLMNEKGSSHENQSKVKLVLVASTHTR
jgi:hypothetical protein